MLCCRRFDSYVLNDIEVAELAGLDVFLLYYFFWNQLLFTFELALRVEVFGFKVHFYSGVGRGVNYHSIEGSF